MANIETDDLQKQMRDWPEQKNRDDDLSFGALRAANKKRSPMFWNAVNGPVKYRNAAGEPADPVRDAWSAADWMVAVLGELGEAANVMKKMRRGDLSFEDGLPKLRREFADTQIYLDLLAEAFNIDLGQAVIDTFNAKSDQLELPLFLTPDGPMTQRPADIRK